MFSFSSLFWLWRTTLCLLQSYSKQMGIPPPPSPPLRLHLPTIYLNDSNVKNATFNRWMVRIKKGKKNKEIEREKKKSHFDRIGDLIWARRQFPALKGNYEQQKTGKNKPKCRKMKRKDEDEDENEDEDEDGGGNKDWNRFHRRKKRSIDSTFLGTFSLGSVHFSNWHLTFFFYVSHQWLVRILLHSFIYLFLFFSLRFERNWSRFFGKRKRKGEGEEEEKKCRESTLKTVEFELWKRLNLNFETSSQQARGKRRCRTKGPLSRYRWIYR